MKKDRILEPDHPFCSSSSDVVPSIENHTFSSEGTSNTSKTRNMREPVSITTVTSKDDLETKLKDIKNSKFKSYRYIPHQYKFY